MRRTILVPFVGGICVGVLTMVVLWLAGQALLSGDAAAEIEGEPDTLLSAIDAIAVVHQVRGENARDGTTATMREVIEGLCPGEAPDWRAVFVYGKWEVTARCTAMPESPVWLVTEPELHILPYTDAAGRLTR